MRKCHIYVAKHFSYPDKCEILYADNNHGVKWIGPTKDKDIQNPNPDQIFVANSLREAIGVIKAKFKNCKKVDHGRVWMARFEGEL